MTTPGGPPGPGPFPGSDDAIAARVKALEAILVERGLLSSDAVDAISAIYENEVGPQHGARITARAWVDEEFKRRLLADATSACAEMGAGGLMGEEMVVLENTDDVHNIIVCTLCSCYPWPVLGLPPSWYKSPAYRSRVVRDPRSVMAEFGFRPADGVEVRVWDSSAELRYWVLPQRPAGTEGWGEEALAALVTRDSLIGVTAAAPAPGAGK